MNCARTLKEEVVHLRKEIQKLNEALSSQRKCGRKPKQKTIRERLSSKMY